jgi:hypothetical protein
MVKANTSIWIEPDVQKGLRILAAEYNMAVGDVIEALLQFGDHARLVSEDMDTLFSCSFMDVKERKVIEFAASRYRGGPRKETT